MMRVVLEMCLYLPEYLEVLQPSSNLLPRTLSLVTQGIETEEQHTGS